MTRLTWGVAAVMALGLTALWAAETSGPDKGTSPMLTIKPANREGDAYCLTCKAGMNPAVVVFATKNDEATQKLLVALNEQAKAGHDRNLQATAIVLGSGDVPDAVVAWVRDQKLSFPVAVVAVDDAGLKPWKLNDKVANTVVFFKGHKVDHSVADLAADKLTEHVGALLGASHTHGNGGDHHM